jgi:hypothetical protein
MIRKSFLFSVIFSLLSVSFLYAQTEQSETVEKTETAEKTESVEKTETVEEVEKNILDSKKTLRLQYFGNEMLSVNAEKNGLKEIIKISDDKMIRKKFDVKMRLIEELTWISASPEKAPDVLFKKTDYQYVDELFTPEIVTESFIVDNQKTVSVYNDMGKIVSKIDYEIEENEKKQTEKETCKMTWKYDEEHRIKEERTVKDRFICYTRYVYHDDFSKADEYYYENSMLMKQKKYETEDSYVLTIYFDEATSVISRFENDTKINEIYYVSGKEVRRREF